MSESEKTQPATPQRRKKAREQGQVARSRELGGAFAIVGVAISSLSLGGDMGRHWIGLYQTLLLAASESDPNSLGRLLRFTTLEALRVMGPILLVGLFLSVSITLAQGGFNIAPAALSLKFDRLSPTSQWSQIVSLAALVNLLKSLTLLGMIAGLVIGALKAEWNDLVSASTEDVRVLLPKLSGLVLKLGWKIVLVLLASSVLDYLLTWRRTERKLRMSHDEIKREYKENDGNPFTKLRIRRRQRAARKRRPLDAAATATLVVTNPTHFAVALKYESSMQAPEVVAKGTDLIAQRLKSIARDNNVPVMEDKLLARALYKSVEVGESIPAELYQAVAEILVAVFRAQAEVQRQKSIQRPHSSAEKVTAQG